MEAKYIGAKVKPLNKGHTYLIEITKPLDRGAYEIKVIYDITAQEDIGKMIPYSSQISIKQNWKIDKVETEND